MQEAHVLTILVGSEAQTTATDKSKSEEEEEEECGGKEDEE